MKLKTELGEVPRFYSVASTILKLVQENRANPKDLIYEKDENHFPKHANTKGMSALIELSIRNEYSLGRVLNESDILKKKLDPWLARVLITELLWGRKTLPPSSAQPVVTVKEYKQKFREILGDALEGGKDKQKAVHKVGIRPYCVRVNTLRMSVVNVIKALSKDGWRQVSVPNDDLPTYLQKLSALKTEEFMQDFHIKELLVFPPNTQLFEHILCKNGSIIYQDKATCLAPFLLKPTPGSTVLDMCAAPGIQTSQLAAIMENKGILYAVDNTLSRFESMCEFLTRHGVTCAKTIHADATKITPQECKQVEYILLDPQCSGSGVKRRALSSEATRNAERLRVAALATTQVALLKQALTQFPSAKRVVYCTRSVFSEENEDVVEKVLDIVNTEKLQFKLADNVLDSWPSRGAEKNKVGRHCLVSGECSMTTGFFIAVFERVNSGDSVEESEEEEEEEEVEISDDEDIMQETITTNRKRKMMEDLNAMKKNKPVAIGSITKSKKSKLAAYKQTEANTVNKAGVKNVIQMMAQRKRKGTAEQDGDMNATKVKQKKQNKGPIEIRESGEGKKKKRRNRKQNKKN